MPLEVKISVRSLVEYVFRSGSIESGFRTNTTLVEGTKAHQKVQKTYKETDQKEVYVHAVIPYEKMTFFIDGRCDGLLFADGEITVDEIKSTSGDLHSIIEESYPVHWAQAKLYAYMYARENETKSMHVQMTYFQVDSEDQKQFKQTLSFQELELFVFDVVRRYAPYASLKLQHECKRDKSIKEIPFPFSRYREGQRKLAGAVYQSIRDQNSLFAEAPTGIGKTISTLFPSVKAIGEGLLKRIFYLTAKTITRTAAEEAFSLMQSKGVHMNTVTITAKDKICFKEETRCQKEYCEFANGYYDRINDAVLDILSNETIMNRSIIEQYARKHAVCPFEFSLDVAYAADAIICDYNYVFDPRVSLKRLFEEHKKQTALLVDEAHNLVDRAREMYSAELRKVDFLQLKQLYKGINEGVYVAADTINKYFIALRKQCGEKNELVLKDLQEELVELLETFVSIAEKELLSERDGELHGTLLEAYFTVQSFIRIAQLYDERYVTYVETLKDDVRIKMFCLDPSYLLQQMGKGYRTKVYYSATLSPLHYYKNMLGAIDDDYVLTLPSPFMKEQLEVIIQPLSTRYRDREQSRKPIVDMIHKLVQEKPGNYLVFFPSYQYLRDVYEQFVEHDASVSTIVQNVGMSEDEREGFLAAFKANNKEAFVGFAVMGGIFSEGVDLVGDRLNGVVIVGVGLPQLCLERNIIKEYFDETGKNGYDYAYVFPGMNKVLQAGGRLIRSEHDQGTIVLVDDRFLQNKYQSLLPYEWRDFTIVR